VIGQFYTFTPAEQCRCECGNLLAKFVPEGIELKCRRCKRIVLLRFAEIEGWRQP
jgi:phage FluMu protein Com